MKSKIPSLKSFFSPIFSTTILALMLTSIVAVTQSKQAMAGHSIKILSCSDRANNLAFSVFATQGFTSRPFQLGFSLSDEFALPGVNNSRRNYCAGACSPISRAQLPNGDIQISGNGESFTFSRELLIPGTQGKISMKAEIDQYPQPGKFHYEGAMTCTAEADIARIMDLGV